MSWRLGGQFVVVGGWLVQAQGTPQNSKYTFRIIRVLRINSVLYRMGRLRSPYDPFRMGRLRSRMTHSCIFGYVRFHTPRDLGFSLGCFVVCGASIEVRAGRNCI